MEDSRGQEFQDSSEDHKSYKELIVSRIVEGYGKPLYTFAAKRIGNLNNGIG